MFNIRSLIFLVLGIIIGSSFTSLFKRSCNDQVAIVKTLPPAAIKKQAEKIAAKFQQKIDSLKESRNELNKQLGKTEDLLSAAKKKNQFLQVQVFDLIDRGKIAVDNRDTLQLLTDCDSLRSKAADMITANLNRDSLHESVTANLELQLKNCDTLILEQENKYLDLRATFNTTLEQQALLTNQNKQYQKQFKRQQLKHKLITAGVLVLSIAATNFIIHH